LRGAATERPDIEPRQAKRPRKQSLFPIAVVEKENDSRPQIGLGAGYGVPEFEVRGRDALIGERLQIAPVGRVAFGARAESMRQFRRGSQFLALAERKNPKRRGVSDGEF